MKHYNITWYQKVEDTVEADSLKAAEKTAQSFITLKNKWDGKLQPASSMLFSVEEITDESSQEVI